MAAGKDLNRPKQLKQSWTLEEVKEGLGALTGDRLAALAKEIDRQRNIPSHSGREGGDSFNRSLEMLQKAIVEAQRRKKLEKESMEEPGTIV